jgi:hypothetical protein
VKKTIATLATTVNLVALAACSGDAGKPAQAPGGPKPSATHAPGGPALVSIPALALQVEAPAGTKVKTLAGRQMLQGPGLGAVVQLAGATKPADLAAAKKEAANLTPENASEEVLADGFVYTFENKGSLGTNYWVMVRRNRAQRRRPQDGARGL